ncbi:MAG: phage terminase large subunit family protein [Nitrospirales bacterium]|nr:hypothetical protein [Nitrospira sp.]MDR4500064.1 phage terminase large subunit family protein [Nitrospirales bacterium]
MINDIQSLPANHIPCPRCEGLMVPESCFNLHYDAGEMEILTWRCLQCGELIDPVILQNRENPHLVTGQKKPRPVLPSAQRTSRKKRPCIAKSQHGVKENITL